MKIRWNRRRPARTEDGFSVVEVVVAAAVSVLVLVSAADLLARLTATTVTIRAKEQAQMVAYQVNERMRAYSCGMVYGSESDLATRDVNCSNGLTGGGGAAQLGVCSQTGTPVFGDVNLCWTDGSRKYDVFVYTWWEISWLTDPTPTDPTCPSTGSTVLPDTFARKIVVNSEGKELATTTVREAAPPNSLAFGTSFARGSGTQSITVGTITITHTGPSGVCDTGGRTLFPKLPSGTSGASTSW
ncbi:MAG: hypothetical protein ACOYN3_10295 [Acidimicrobiia bacterium]